VSLNLQLQKCCIYIIRCVVFNEDQNTPAKYPHHQTSNKSQFVRVPNGSGWLNRKIFHRNFLTETKFDRRPFDREFILPKKVIWPKQKFIKRSFDQKYLENSHLTANLTWKISQMAEMTYDRKFKWPKAFSKNGQWLKGN
jgi:hypothetical protein